MCTVNFIYLPVVVTQSIVRSKYTMPKVGIKCQLNHVSYFIIVRVEVCSFPSWQTPTCFTHSYSRVEVYYLPYLHTPTCLAYSYISVYNS